MVHRANFYEEKLPNILAMVGNIDYSVCEAILAGESFHVKLKTIDAVFHKIIKDKTIRNKFTKLIKDVNSANKSRNLYIHGRTDFGLDSIWFSQPPKKELGIEITEDAYHVSLDDIRKANDFIESANEALMDFVHKEFIEKPHIQKNRYTF